MKIQHLLEHSDTILELLKQIKIANKTGANTVPPAFCKLFAFKNNGPVTELFFQADKLGKSKEYYLNVFIYNNSANINWTMVNEYNQEKNEGITHTEWPRICEFFQILPQKQPLNFKHFTAWTPYLENLETLKIIEKEAEYQAQQQNWPFL